MLVFYFNQFHEKFLYSKGKNNKIDKFFKKFIKHSIRKLFSLFANAGYVNRREMKKKKIEKSVFTALAFEIHIISPLAQKKIIEIAYKHQG